MSSARLSRIDTELRACQQELTKLRRAPRLGGAASDKSAANDAILLLKAALDANADFSTPEHAQIKASITKFLSTLGDITYTDDGFDATIARALAENMMHLVNGMCLHPPARSYLPSVSSVLSTYCDDGSKTSLADFKGVLASIGTALATATYEGADPHVKAFVPTLGKILEQLASPQ
jgi:hypothetical protein